MNETQKIPWKRISVEAAAIVASILLAFAIDAWWDERQEQNRLADTLAGLEAALSNSLTIIDDNIEIITTNREVVSAFVRMTPDEAAQIPIAERYSTLTFLYRPNTLDINKSFIAGILDSNSLESLTNSSLQVAIAQWRGALEEVDEYRFLLAGKHQDDVLQALARHEEIGSAFAEDRTGRANLSADAMRRAREDPDLLALASLKVLRDGGHIFNLRLLRDETESILFLLKNR